MHIVEESENRLVIRLDTLEAQEIASDLLDKAKFAGDAAKQLGNMLRDAGFCLPEEEKPHFEHHNPLDH
ncbi:hypothetical protein [Thermithiobacillus plumbiphilus]|uniref:Uncharacterized protein n=1 Tax=Thermithiobacillus plumbiphilus TaxID=1729899 RepID=A0ABU9D9H5_9PROT